MWSDLFGKLLGRPAQVPQRRRAHESRRKAERAEAVLAFDIQPLDIPELVSIDSRAASAHPRQLRRWIDDIDRQLPLMRRDVRSLATDLRLRLQRLFDDQTPSSRL